jgi:hypothetical protein
MRMKHSNKAALAAWEDQDIDRAPAQYQAPILTSCDHHAATFEEGALDLDYWLSVLVSPEEKEDVTHFVAGRTRDLGAHLRAAYGLLL